MDDPALLSGITLVPAPDLHTVTFDTCDAGTVAPQAVKDGECAQRPDDPSKEGFRFIGWRLVTNGKMSSTDFDFSTPITADTLLKAFYLSAGERSTLAWKTSEFSTYLLAYKDAGSSGSGGTAAKASSTVSTGSSAPKTGDDPFAIPAAVAIAVLAGIVVLVSRRRLSSR